MIVEADAAAVVAAVAGSVAAAAAIIGGLYAALTYYRQRSDARVAATRHIALVQPRPALMSANVDLGAGPKLTITYANPGGAATHWVAIFRAGRHLFAYSAPVPAHWQHPPGGITTLTKSITLPSKSPDGVVETIASYARDVDGQAWDVLTGCQTPLSQSEFLNGAVSPIGATVGTDGRLELVANA